MSCSNLFTSRRFSGIPPVVLAKTYSAAVNQALEEAIRQCENVRPFGDPAMLARVLLKKIADLPTLKSAVTALDKDDWLVWIHGKNTFELRNEFAGLFVCFLGHVRLGLGKANELSGILNLVKEFFATLNFGHETFDR